MLHCLHLCTVHWHLRIRAARRCFRQNAIKKIKWISVEDESCMDSPSYDIRPLIIETRILSQILKTDIRQEIFITKLIDYNVDILWIAFESFLYRNSYQNYAPSSCYHRSNKTRKCFVINLYIKLRLVFKPQSNLLAFLRFTHEITFLSTFYEFIITRLHSITTNKVHSIRIINLQLSSRQHGSHIFTTS